MKTILETPVLIVGGGPVGLSLAMELAWRGIESLEVERTDGSIDTPKTGAITNRTMEFCRRWGIEERVRRCGFPDDYELSMVFCTSIAGHLLARHPYASMRDERPYPGSPVTRQRAPQMFFDPILAAAVREQRCADLRYHHEFLDFEERGNELFSRVRDLRNNEEITVVSQYLAACDGAGSPIRRGLGIEMEGDAAINYSIAIFIRAPRFLAQHDKGQAERYIFVGPEGTWGNLTVVDGRELWRLTVMGTKELIEDVHAHPLPWVKRCMGDEAIEFEIISALPWRRSRLVAGRYTQGRVFLVGDSAHTMSPTGGFGMNTGVGDAVDIGWKFEAMLRGWGGAALLDSYDTERRPVGWRNVNAASDNFNAMTSARDCHDILGDDHHCADIRQRVGEQLRIATQKEWESNGVSLGYRYEGSPIIVADGTSPTEDDASIYIQTARPGHRAPHFWLREGRSTLDLFGKGFVLLRLGANSGDASPLVQAAGKRRLPLSTIDLPDPAVAALYASNWALVRPDGHVAWRSNALPAMPDQVIDTVRGAA